MSQPAAGSTEGPDDAAARAAQQRRTVMMCSGCGESTGIGPGAGHAQTVADALNLHRGCRRDAT